MADDFTITPYGIGLHGTAFDRETQVVVIHDGRRGVKGDKGPKGDKGDQGDSINVYGAWTKGTIYCPGDAVTDRSTLLVGVTSLYIQRSSSPCSVSNTPPWQALGRWTEVSDKDWTNSFGGIWEVYQIDHGFTKIGQPVGYSWQANRYVLANATAEDELGTSLVREVVDKDRVILQSTGGIPNIDPSVIYPDTGTWQNGRIYYVSTARGRLELEPPVDPNAYTNPILQVAEDGAPLGIKNGIALPWRPVAGAKEYMPVGWTKFYYTATDGQILIDGADDNAQVLHYYPGANTDVFINGLNLFHDQYTATDGYRIHLFDSLNAGDLIEVWTPDRPLDILVKSTTLKLDNIEASFDGTRTQFDLTYGQIPVIFQEETSVHIMLDSTPQEPFVDFILIPDGNAVDIQFKQAPPPGTRFWGIAMSPSGQLGVPPGGDTGAVLSKVSPADADMYWAETIFGGSW